MKKTKTKECYLCETEIDKLTYGLNIKLLGKKITRYFCISCLADYLDVTVDDLLAKAEDFKRQGCTLF